MRFLDMRADTQTDRQTDTLLPILRTPAGSDVMTSQMFRYDDNGSDKPFAVGTRHSHLLLQRWRGG